MPGIPAEPLALLKMLNAACISTFLVLGLSVAFYVAEVTPARIGRLLLVLGAAIYLMRAVGEVCLMPSRSP